ncbi:AAA family ATPase [Azoarcus sp. L1K30]|uniref:LuxR C-terminal-related transcriptional regulator n=1 Tax=Azoarcus sp. L1K30 TaxID=2820277 RepID=UPI001B8279D4|nr:LuxR C-terminal-related transcriptional regulator [Azoarcus sp. L1K30]MBR0568891.1 AAA family ATPase [Azoarcus sp. L1K30]
MLSHPAVPGSVRINTRKLRPNYESARKIARHRITEIVSGSPANLVVVTAPAGYGKSTAMGQLHDQLQQEGIRVGWLTVDANENDLGRFAVYLWSALSRVLPELDEPPVLSSGMESAAGSTSGRIQQLIETVSLIETPFALFIDDFEQVSSPKVLSVVSTLVAGLSPGQRLILGTRQHPDLPLGRLRVVGRLLDIEADLLKFDADETRRYIAEQLQCSLNEDDLATLQARTDGWPAALQLAAAALIRRPDAGDLLKGLKDSTQSISDYLAEDVLGCLPDGHRRFLLKTSLLDSFCPVMCERTLGEADSLNLLAQTERDNLFLQKIDSDGPWYRYHPLFREFLSEQYRLSNPSADEVRQIQLNAARWLVENGKPFPAIPYALDGGDPQLAARIMATRATDLIRIGQLDTVMNWINALPQPVLPDYPELAIAGAYAATFLHRYSDAKRLVNMVPESAAQDTDIAYELVAVKIMLSAWSDRLIEAFEVAENATEGLDSAPPYVAGLVRNACAFHSISTGDDTAALRHLAIAKHCLEPIGAIHGLNYSLSFEGCLSLLHGRVNDARVRLERLLDSTVSAGHRYTISTAIVAAHLSEALYETDELCAAETLLVDYLPLIHDGCLPDHAIVAYRLRARAQAYRGQRNEALNTLDTLQDMGDIRSIPRIAAAARIEKQRLALIAGDIIAAQRMMPLITSPSIWQSFEGLSNYAEDLDDPLIAAFRLALVEGTPQALIPQIQDAICVAGARNRRRRTIRLQCLLAQAFEVTRRRPLALETLERALINTQVDGLIRVVADESWQLMPLLDALEAHKTDIAPAYLRKLRNAAHRSALEVPAKPQAETASPLTPRENQILRLLADGHSNKALADKLFVSENTVQTHLRRIYSKLGIRSRTQAIAKALDHGLLH